MYALNLAKDGRILSATYDKYAPKSQPRVDVLPNGSISDYRCENGEYIYDPLPEEKPQEAQPTQEERIAALEEELNAAKILLGLEA